MQDKQYKMENHIYWYIAFDNSWRYRLVNINNVNLKLYFSLEVMNYLLTIKLFLLKKALSVSGEI